MTAEEKLIQAIREYLIDTEGDEFLTLTEEEQSELILAKVRELMGK